MKCTNCLLSLDTSGMVVTLVSNGATYTAVLHRACLSHIIGLPQTRKLESLAFLSGWRQEGLPGFEVEPRTKSDRP
jgi:hypothetical protein